MRRPLVLLLAWPAAVAACAPAGTGTTAVTRTAPHTAATTASPAGSATAQASLQGCPATLQLAAAPMVARFGVAPDDATGDSAGTVWISATDAGSILRLDPDGRVSTAFSEPGEPEGLATLADGGLVIALQGPNRVVRRAPDGAETTLLQLGPTTAVEPGVDGLAVRGSAVIVPDSAGGGLLSVPLAGGPATRIASGLGRPVGVAVLPDGGLVVTGESGPVTLMQIDGAVRPIAAGLRKADDVVWDRGLLDVTDLEAGTLSAVDPQTGATRVLISHAPQPQGLVLRADGTLLLIDSTARVAVRVATCG